MPTLKTRKSGLEFMYQFEVNKRTKQVFGNFFFKATKSENPHKDELNWMDIEIELNRDRLNWMDIEIQLNKDGLNWIDIEIELN